MFGATRDDIRAMPGAVWLLLAGTFVNRFGSFVIAFLVLYLTDAGHTIAQAGIAVSVYGIGGLGAAAAGGYLTDRVGRRRTIALSMFSAAATMIALTTTEALPVITVLAGFAGFTSELYRPASAAYLTDLTDPEQRVTAFALYRLAINAGAAAGPAVGGFVAEHSFDWLFYGDAITSVVFGIMALMVLPTTLHRRQAGATNAGGPRRFRIAADPGLVVFVLAVAATALLYIQGYSTYAVQVTAFGFSSSVYGMLIGLNGLLVILLEIPITAITRRFSARPVMATGAVLIGAGFGLISLGDSLAVLVAAITVVTFGEMIQMPVAGAFIANRAPDHLRGRYMGAFSLAFGLGIVFGPGLGTWAFHFNPATLWMSCFIVGVISAILSLLIPKRPPWMREAGDEDAITEADSAAAADEQGE